MTDTPALRLLVRRDDLHQQQWVSDPHAPAQRALAAGEVRLQVLGFALTANNVTYAAFGDAMKYWDFFPAADAAWGCIPVWGFALVQQSRCEGVAEGELLYGFLPMGSHLVVQPTRPNAGGFSDGARHRQELAAVYNHLQRCGADPLYRAEQQAQQALLRPLFTTSFLIDDFLAEQNFFGAKQVLFTSASSKTAYGSAFCLSQRRAQGGAPRLLGLSSAANAGFARSLGCYDQVLDYASLDALPLQPTVLVDFAGHAALRAALHTRLGTHLAYSCAVGGTHWEDRAPSAALPGPRPVLFFAPTQVKKRSAPPPEGWGPQGLQQRLAAAWAAFMQPVNDARAPWLQVRESQGLAQAQPVLQQLLAGQVAPRDGHFVRL